MMHRYRTPQSLKQLQQSTQYKYIECPYLVRQFCTVINPSSAEHVISKLDGSGYRI